MQNEVKGGSPKQRATVQHDDSRQGEKWKMAGCFTLLRRITRLKNVNSEIRSEDRSSYLERYSPKGSCHLDESSMSHTLAQNGRCEFCCGMHRTCKDTNSNEHDEMNLYTYNHSGRWWYKTTANNSDKIYVPPAATYMRPGAGLFCILCRYVYTGTFCSVFIGRWLQCSPAAPCNLMKFYISTDGTHTHTRPAAAGQMKWNESEMTMTMKWKLPNQDAKRGTQKKRAGANTNTNAWPGAGKRWKGKGKEKRRPTDTKQDQRRRGKTEAPKATYHSET